jgi:hypothetical protein
MELQQGSAMGVGRALGGGGAMAVSCLAPCAAERRRKGAMGSSAGKQGDGRRTGQNRAVEKRRQESSAGLSAAHAGRSAMGAGAPWGAAPAHPLQGRRATAAGRSWSWSSAMGKGRPRVLELGAGPAMASDRESRERK